MAPCSIQPRWEMWFMPWGKFQVREFTLRWPGYPGGTFWEGGWWGMPIAGPRTPSPTDTLTPGYLRDAGPRTYSRPGVPGTPSPSTYSRPATPQGLRPWTSSRPGRDVCNISWSHVLYCRKEVGQESREGGGNRATPCPDGVYGGMCYPPHPTPG